MKGNRMIKVYVVCRGVLGQLGPEIVAAFKNEGDAWKSAESHRSADVKVWVEEVNYYE